MYRCAALALLAQSQGSCMHPFFWNREVALLAAIYLASFGLASVPGATGAMANSALSRHSSALRHLILVRLP